LEEGQQVPSPFLEVNGGQRAEQVAHYSAEIKLFRSYLSGVRGRHRWLYNTVP